MAHKRRSFGLIATLGLLLAMAPAAAGAETVLITGANSGIGLELTKQYLAKGWTVISTHRRADLPPTLAELSAKYKNLLRIEKVDVTDIEQVKALAARRPDLFPKVPAVPDLAGGLGGMMRFTPFGGDKEKIGKACRTCFDEGVILFSCGHGPYHMRVLPPLPVFKMEDWPRVFACIERGLSKV